MATPLPLLRAPSRIVAATVFSSRAHVTRRARAEVSGGLSRVAFEGLPPGVDLGDLRVAVDRGVVRFVESDRVPRTKALGGSEAGSGAEASGAEASARARERLEAEVFRLEGERAALAEEIELIDQVVPAAGRPEQHGALRPDAFLAGLEALTTRRRSAQAALREAERALERAREVLEKLLARRAHLGQSDDEEPRTLVVMGLEVEEPCVLTLDVTYPAPWATWRPFYNLRLDAKRRVVEVERLADVWQETGEDWQDVALRLSTAEPEAGLRVPTVPPWYLELRTSFEDRAKELYAGRRAAPPGAPPPLAAKAAAPAAAMPAPAPARRAAAAPPRGGGFGGGDDASEQTFAEAGDAPFAAELARFEDTEGSPGETSPGEVTGSFDAVAAAPRGRAADRGGRRDHRDRSPAPRAPSVHPDQALLDAEALPRDASGGIDFELPVSGPVRLPSGRHRQRLSLGSASYPMQLLYLLRPAVKDFAFGQVAAVNAESAPLLAGPAAIFLDQGYAGTTRLATTPARGQFLLELGAETSLKCTRRTSTTVRTEGLISKEDVHEVEVKIDVESFLSEVAEVEVQDQVPISTDPRVRVRLVRTSPKDASLDDKTGIVTFRARLAPASRLELTMTYEIEVPKDYRLSLSLEEPR